MKVRQFTAHWPDAGGEYAGLAKFVANANIEVLHIAGTQDGGLGLLYVFYIDIR